MLGSERFQIRNEHKLLTDPFFCSLYYRQIQMPLLLGRDSVKFHISIESVSHTQLFELPEDKTKMKCFFKAILLCAISVMVGGQDDKRVNSTTINYFYVNQKQTVSSKKILDD
jgi:hypothetical protein